MNILDELAAHAQERVAVDMAEIPLEAMKELAAVKKVCDVYNNMHSIPCTSCRYCIEESSCPKHILIPDLFSSYNAKMIFNDWNANHYYERAISNNGKASDCIRCGKCERVCPQHLPIRDLLQTVAKEFKE